MAKAEKKKQGREKLSEQEKIFREQRSERALRLRNSLRLTRDYFQKKYGISLTAMQAWEDDKYGGMPESGAIALSNAYQAEGIPVTVEWLMYGMGEDPLEGLVIGGYRLKKLSEKAESQSLSHATENPIMDELKIFYKNHKNAVHLIVEDDGLAPLIMPGDYVAGKWLFDEDIKTALDFPCIVEIESGKKTVRIVRSGSYDNLYDIACINPNYKILKDNKLLAAAPIIRIWKSKPSGKF